MNLKQVDYIVKIAEYQNISKAAENLYVSRSALNNFLLQLENDLKIQLFHRLNKRLMLTYAGELYVSASKRILEIQNQLNKDLADIVDDTKGMIKIGINRNIGEKLFKETFPIFHKKFPGYNIKLSTSQQLEKDLVEKRIDWAISGFGAAKQCPPDIEQIPLGTCEIVVALPITHPFSKSATTNSSGEATRSIDLKLLKDENFVLLRPGLNSREIADERFREAGFVPNILVECNEGLLASQLVKAGIGISILIETQVAQDPSICYFSLEPKAYWTHSLAYRNGTAFSKAESFYTDLLRHYLSKKGSKESPSAVTNPISLFD